MEYLKGSFHKAGIWFVLFALLAASPLLLFAIPGFLVNAFSVSTPVASLLQMAAIILVPIASAYILGGLFGRAILDERDITIWRARIRGLLIAGGSLLCFFLLNVVDIQSTPYSNDGGIVSQERSMSLIKTICTFMAPVVLIIGGWAGGALKTKAEKSGKSV